MHAGALGSQGRHSALVTLEVATGQRERAKLRSPGSQSAADQGDNAAGVETSGKTAAHRYVGPQLSANGQGQLFPDALGNILVRHVCRCLMRLPEGVRSRNAPVRRYFDPVTAAELPNLTVASAFIVVRDAQDEKFGSVRGVDVASSLQRCQD